MRIYFDNAATTPLDPLVKEAMMPYLETYFGNPSSIHAYGRESRSAIENARKTVARLLHCSPSEIFFTSGATEADNLALTGSVFSLGITTLITSPIEHHAVLHTAQWLSQRGFVSLQYVKLTENGHIDLEHLEFLLSQSSNALVSLMHGNNEVGNVTDLMTISALCRKYGAVFHSDTVQTIGHMPIHLQQLDIDFLVGSAHKFHGPKGVGFIYINGRQKIGSILHGGSQERSMRGGTENVPGIVGLAKALELAYAGMETNKAHLLSLKKQLCELLQSRIPDLLFNGDCLSESQSLPHIISVATPVREENEMLLFNLDIEKIAISGGSACTSGATAASHVLEELKVDPQRGVVRFSFSKYNTAEETERVAAVFSRIFS